MTGPDGSTTKRDERREARRQQLQRQQTTRGRARTRAIRTRQTQRAAIIGAGVLLVLVLALLVAHFAFGAFGPSLQRANGQTVDGMHCDATPGQKQHLHAYLAIYVNGQQTAVPTGIGIVPEKHCTYPLSVQAGQPDIVDVQSGTTQTYTLGQFFDIWGQPLSNSQVQGHTSDATHKLVFEVFDASGNLLPYTGSLRDLPLKDHETIVIRYNSPNAKPTPYTNWGSITK